MGGHRHDQGQVSPLLQALAPRQGRPSSGEPRPVTCKLARPLAQQNGLRARIVTSAVFFVVGTGLVLQARRALLRELRGAGAVACAAQRVLVRPLPARVAG